MYDIVAIGRDPVYPPVQGGMYATYATLNAISRYANSVVYICSSPHATREIKINERFDVIEIKQQKISIIKRKILSAGTKISLVYPNRPLMNECFYLAHKELRECVYQKIKQAQKPVIYFEFPGGYMSFLRNCTKYLKILRAHNIELSYALAYHGTGTWWREKITRWVLKKLEGEFANHCDLIFTLAPEDSLFFEQYYKIPKEKIVWIPPPFDTTAIALPTKEEKKAIKEGIHKSSRIIAVFMEGGIRDQKKKDFYIRLDNLLTNCGKKNPNVDFIVMGRVCEMLNVKLPNVKLLGVVDNPTKERYMMAADFALNPAQAGVGISIKMLDYMAHGLPVIATKEGCRGTMAKDGESAVIRDFDSFPDGIEYLLSDEKRMCKIGQNARKIIEQYFDIDMVGKKAIEAIDSAYNKKFGQR